MSHPQSCTNTSSGDLWLYIKIYLIYINIPHLVKLKVSIKSIICVFYIFHFPTFYSLNPTVPRTKSSDQEVGFDSWNWNKSNICPGWEKYLQDSKNNRRIFGRPGAESGKKAKERLWPQICSGHPKSFSRESQNSPNSILLLLFNGALKTWDFIKILRTIFFYSLFRNFRNITINLRTKQASSC